MSVTQSEETMEMTYEEWRRACSDLWMEAGQLLHAGKIKESSEKEQEADRLYLRGRGAKW